MTFYEDSRGWQYTTRSGRKLRQGVGGHDENVILHDMPQVWETWDLAERLARAADEVEKNGKRKA